MILPTPFQQKVYTLCSQIPSGKVVTYQDIAHTLHINSAQAIGQALKCNPYAPQVPCHRVIKSDGSIGGFMGKTTEVYINKKIQLLRAEGINITNNRIDLTKYHYYFSPKIFKHDSKH